MHAKEKARVAAGFLVRSAVGLSWVDRLPATATTTAATAATAAIATATAATAAVATATAARTTATTTGAGTILRFVDAQRTPAHGVAVQRLDRTGRIILRHFDEAEAARTTGITVNRQRHRLDGTMLREQRTNRRLVCRKRQIAYINFRHLWKHSLVTHT